MTDLLSGKTPRQCKAKSKRTGGRCRQNAVRGGTVCWRHGGAAPQVRKKARQRLLEAAEPAIVYLEQSLEDLTKIANNSSTSDADKVKAISARLKGIDSILDRTGYPRGAKVEVDDGQLPVWQQILVNLQVAKLQAQGIPLPESDNELYQQAVDSALRGDPEPDPEQQALPANRGGAGYYDQHALPPGEAKYADDDAPPAIEGEVVDAPDTPGEWTPHHWDVVQGVMVDKHGRTRPPNPAPTAQMSEELPAVYDDGTLRTDPGARPTEPPPRRGSRVGRRFEG